MAADSSPRKRSKKASTPDRSTTSSTTGPTAKAVCSDETTSDDPSPLTATDEFDPFTRPQQREFEKLLSGGLSPAAACAKLDVPLDVLWATIDCDDRFVKRCRRILEALNENVRSAIYLAAMNGKVAAQTNWLRLMQMEENHEERAVDRKGTKDPREALQRRAHQLSLLFGRWSVRPTGDLESQM
jgi:hypothetical protein